MKKLFLFAFAAFALVACNNSTTPTEGENTDSTQTSQEVAPVEETTPAPVDSMAAPVETPAAETPAAETK